MSVWQRHGIVFSPQKDIGEGRPTWMHSHSYLPTPLVLPDRIRVYVAYWDKEKIGRPGYIDFALDDPSRVLNYSRGQILELGTKGCFDEHGISPLWAVNCGDQIRLYYAGWQRSPTVRYFLFTGLAISRDGGESFERYQDVPIIDRSPGLWQVRTGGCFLNINDVWHCWYAEFQDHLEINGKLMPSYNWSHMQSSDGIHWPNSGQVCLAARPGEVLGYGRATVMKHGSNYRAWISVRDQDQGYRIGYVTSPDGLKWTAPSFDRFGLRPRDSGFESGETAFAGVVRLSEGRLAMYYNGNNFGEYGLALATCLEKDIA